MFFGFLHRDNMSASFVHSKDQLERHDLMNSQVLHSWGGLRGGIDALQEARNSVVRQFLETPECDWLFFVDDDMGFRPDTLDRLLGSADPETAPMVGALCFAYREYGTDGFGGYRRYPLPTIFEYQKHPDGQSRFTGLRHYPVNQLIPVHATGAACVLIHRSILEGIEEEWGPVWFDRVHGPDGRQGEDISFCTRVAALGFPMHVHTGIRTTHHKNLWLSDVDFWASFVAPPATEPTVVLVPTIKERTHTLRALAETLRASTGLADLWFVVDDDDHAAIAKEYGNVIVEPGTFAHKLNAAYPQIPDVPWLFVTGDDVRFHPQWLDHCQHVARLYGAKVIGTNDLANPRVTEGDHATHMLISTSYIDEEGASWDGPGTVAHEGYGHWYVDDEIVAVAKQRDVWQAALGAIVEHMHPFAGKAENDAVYEKGLESVKADERLWLERQAEYR